MVRDLKKRTGVKSLSITPETFEHAASRVGDLYPIVKNFSAYLQFLIELDYKYKVIEEALASGKLPGSSGAAIKTRKLRTGEKAD